MKLRSSGIGLCSAALLLVALVDCSSVTSEDAAGSDRGTPSAEDAATGGVSTNSPPASDGGAVEPPPEVELEETFRSPVATGRLVWSANPSTNRVALVDAQDLTVQAVEVGEGPTYLAAIPSPEDSPVNRALVMNVDGNDASLLLESEGAVTEQRVPLHPQANAWSVSASGRWAIAWTDVDRVGSADPTEGFQSITVIRIPEVDAPASTVAQAYRLTAGYRPHRVFINDDESRAFIVAEPGITVVELDDVPTVGEDVSLGSADADETARDVSVTPNGRFALVRREGNPTVEVLEIATGETATVTLLGPVTDLDLVADGSRAIAVVRQVHTNGASGGGGQGGGGAAEGGKAGSFAGGPGVGAAGAPNAGAAGDGGREAVAGAISQGGNSGGVEPDPLAVGSQVAILRLPDIFDDPGSYDSIRFADLRVGSVSASIEGDRALLFTNALPSDALTILNTADGDEYLTYRVVRLKSPIQAVFPAPDAKHAIALLQPDPETSTRPGAFSVVPIERKAPPLLQGTDAPPMSVALASTRGVVTVRDDDAELYGAYVVRLPEMQLDAITLKSPPLATGLVPAASRAFVAQDHPEGRITFIHLTVQTDDPEFEQELTGFELATRVIGDAGDRQ